MTPSTTAVHALAARFADFNQHLITFVEQCSPADWRKVTQAEKWAVDLSAGQLFSAVFIDYAQQHLDSMKATVQA